MDNVKSLYLYVTSKDSEPYFPHNKPSIFHVKLNNTLNLNGSWEIGVCSVDLAGVNVSKNVDASKLFIVCKICSDMIVDGKQTRILRSLPLKPDINETYHHIYYVPIEVRFIDSIEFRIINDAAGEASFGSEDKSDTQPITSNDEPSETSGSSEDKSDTQPITSMTLHLKRSYQI